MPFRLLRLPLVALREVIKSMNMREILIFPFLSEKCHQIVKASFSKKSALEITFTPEKNFINVAISPEHLYGVKWPDQGPGEVYKTGDELERKVQFSTCNRCAKFRWSRSDQVAENEESIRDMLEWFADTMKASVSFEFDVETRQDFAMEMIRYCRQQHIRMSWIKFHYGASASPEYVREILEGSSENEFILIDSSLPKAFEYTPPPGGFKMEGVNLTDADWVNLEDFLQCKKVVVHGDLFHMTPQYLNSVFKTIVNTECRIRGLFLCGTSFKQNNYTEIIKELSDRPLEVEGIHLRVEFKARNGRKTLIFFENHSIHLIQPK